MKRSDFVFRKEWWSEIEKLAPSEQAELVDDICRYAAGLACAVRSGLQETFERIINQTRVNPTRVNPIEYIIYIINNKDIDYIYSNIYRNNIYSSSISNICCNPTTNNCYVCVFHICDILSNINAREKEAVDEFVYATRQGMFEWMRELANANMPIRQKETILNHWRDLYSISGGDANVANAMLDKAKVNKYTDLIYKNYGCEYNQGCGQSARDKAESILARINACTK